LGSALAEALIVALAPGLAEAEALDIELAEAEDIALAEALDMTTIVEGIETEEQLAFLRSHRCPFGQGYLLGRPVPARDLKSDLVVNP